MLPRCGHAAAIEAAGALLSGTTAVSELHSTKEGTMTKAKLAAALFTAFAAAAAIVPPGQVAAQPPIIPEGCALGNGPVCKADSPCVRWDDTYTRCLESTTFYLYWET